jgi:hypothetical protein
MRVQRATHPVHETGRRDRISLHRDQRPRRGPAHGDGSALDVSECCVDGVHVRGAHLAGDVGGAQGMEHADRLRRAEAEVEGGHRDPVMRPPQTPKGHGVVTLEHRCKRVACDLAAQAERACSGAQPLTGRLNASAGPVPRHLEVIRMPTLVHLGHPQHPTSEALLPNLRRCAPMATVT